MTRGFLNICVEKRKCSRKKRKRLLHWSQNPDTTLHSTAHDTCARQRALLGTTSPNPLVLHTPNTRYRRLCFFRAISGLFRALIGGAVCEAQLRDYFASAPKQGIPISGRASQPRASNTQWRFNWTDSLLELPLLKTKSFNSSCFARGYSSGALECGKGCAFERALRTKVFSRCFWRDPGTGG